MAKTVNTEPNQKSYSHRFKPGQSGNPNGRPKGVRNRVTLLAEKLVDDSAEQIINKIIEHAKLGEPNALKVLIDRILPVRKDRPSPFEMPIIKTAKDLPPAMAAITQAVALGDLTLSEASEASRLLANFVQAVEVTDIINRLEVLESERFP